ncbi:MAG: hypothetical protein ACK4HV_05100, partial [Parachlamydiaceae bacterium]
HLYLTFFGFPFEKFLRLDKSILFYLILFCKSIGYIRGDRELQRVYANGINDYKMALDALLLASKHRLDIIESFSRRYLGEIELFKVIAKEVEPYVAVTITIDNLQSFGSNDLSVITKGFLSYPYSTFNRSLQIFITQFFSVNSQSVMVSCEKLTLEDFREKKQALVLSSTKRLKDLDGIDHIILGYRQNSLILNYFESLSLYFTRISTIAYSCMDKISDDFLRKISDVKPNLDCFVISMHKSAILPEDIQSIANRFKHLSKIGFSFVDISKEVFSAVLSSKQIVKIEISNSRFDLPHDLSLLGRLQQLELINIDKNHPESISHLLLNSKNVRFLSIVNVAGFSFGSFPFPLNIIELSGSFDSFFKEKDHLIKFKNLKVLKLLDFNRKAAMLADYIPQDAVIVMGNLKYIR